MTKRNFKRVQLSFLVPYNLKKKTWKLQKKKLKAKLCYCTKEFIFFFSLWIIFCQITMAEIATAVMFLFFLKQKQRKHFKQKGNYSKQDSNIQIFKNWACWLIFFFSFNLREKHWFTKSMHLFFVSQFYHCIPSLVSLTKKNKTILLLH